MKPAHEFILFDLDGTLSDPLVGIARSINFALAHFGFPERSFDEVKTYVGPPLELAFMAFTGVEERAAIDAFIAKYRERYGDVGYAENVVYDGVPQMLRRLADAGLHMGVCTSKRADFAERILRMFGLRNHFEWVSGGNIGIHKWQQIEALRENGAIDDTALMVGDRAVDIVAAHRNGLQAAGVLWGHGSKQELEAERPGYLFSRPEEVLSLVRAEGQGRRAAGISR